MDRVNLESSASARACIPIAVLLVCFTPSVDWLIPGRASEEACRTGFPHAQSGPMSDEEEQPGVDAGQRDNRALLSLGGRPARYLRLACLWPRASSDK